MKCGYGVGVGFSPLKILYNGAIVAVADRIVTSFFPGIYFVFFVYYVRKKHVFYHNQ